jgi:hypothetical protein
MNERIRELAEQAGYYIDPDFDIEFEVFAKLIVSECVNVADEVSMDDTVGYALLEHFGVKE